MFIKIVSAFLLVISINICAFSQEALSKARPPEPASLSGCARAHCVALSDGVRICKCISEAEDVFVATRGTEILGKWPTTAFLGATLDFEVLTGDLDGDRNKELIVANHDGTSNGLGINYWTISILPAGSLQDFRRPLMFSVEEYGSFGTFVKGRREVRILATRWLRSKALRGRLGDGLYLFGRLWRYKGGELLPVARQPLVARRLLESFAEERERTLNNPHVPYLWLNNPGAETRRLDPQVDFKVKETQEGVISDVVIAPVKGENTISIIFQPSGKPAITYAYPVNSGENAQNALRHVGEAANSIIYPSNYLPAQPLKWLKGRRCKIVRYDDGNESEDLKVLWLL